MRCKRCGRRNPEGRKRCVYCGHSLVSAHKSKSKSNSTHLSNLIVALAILLVVAVVVLIALLVKNVLDRPGKQFVGIGEVTYEALQLADEESLTYSSVKDL